jgi:hypothetical protein
MCRQRGLVGDDFDGVHGSDTYGPVKESQEGEVKDATTGAAGPVFGSIAPGDDLPVFEAMHQRTSDPVTQGDPGAWACLMRGGDTTPGPFQDRRALQEQAILLLQSRISAACTFCGNVSGVRGRSIAIAPLG